MRRRLILVVLSLLVARSALAFNPPTDTAGALLARIEGPGEVTRAGAPFPIRVVLENKGDRPIEGTIRLGVTDQWTTNPAAPVAFSVAPKATATREFTVVAAVGSYDAHYPIHAYARFSADGREWIAHPILIVATKLGTAARPARTPEWSTFPVSDRGALALWRLPAHRAVVQVFGKPARTLPTGWRGVDEPTGTAIDIRSQEIGPDRLDVVGIHEPYRDGNIGSAAVEFPLKLPAEGPIRLTFGMAVTPDGKGDGVTFRVRAVPFDAPAGTAGTVVFERHSAAKGRAERGTADLSRFAGRALRLQLESHPGPRNDTGWDQSYWVEPTLQVGAPATPVPFPPRDNIGSIPLGSTRSGTFATEVRVWPGARGILDAVVGFRTSAGWTYLRGFEVRVDGMRLDDARSPVALLSVKVGSQAGSYLARHEFKSVDGAFELVSRLAIEDGVLRARFSLENATKPQPWHVIRLEDVAPGPWSKAARRVYAGHGNVIRDPGPFTLGFDGHRLSTSFVGIDFEGGVSMVQAVDTPPSEFEVRPEARRYALHADVAPTFSFVPAANVFEGVKTWRAVNGLKASSGVNRAAGRFVFDLWGGRYADAASGIRRAARYGLRDALVVWHDWQRWGYDYRLPDVYPPSPQPGTAAELKDLIAACKESGTLCALHDNYIDFYPDADGFSYEREIAFDGEGRPVRAWLNEGRGAQSYRFRADRVETFVARNLQPIRAELAPSAYFIDVWSSIQPYDYWTADGRYHDRLETRDVWRRTFAKIRDDLGNQAPQISESGHDQLIGGLDGAQTNHLRVGKPISKSRDGGTLWNWPCADAERTPWFDAAHHDRFILHGAGYPGRYEAGLDSKLHGIDSDDYVSTEVLDGHPGMVAQAFGYHVARKYWLTNRLMRALALKRIDAVEYVGDDLHRQHVRWSGGGEVWVNRGASDWEIAGKVLPEYGFYARVPSESGVVEAGIVRRDGLIVEESSAPGELYVNARGATGGPSRIRPVVSDVRRADGRTVAFMINWHADDPVPTGYTPFLHFCDERGEIVFQAGQIPSVFAGNRQGVLRATATGALPTTLKPGDSFELRAGLYDPNGGPRLPLAGPDDGTGRLRLGTLRVAAGGRLVWEPHRESADPARARRNPDARPVDFGAVTTAGGVRLTRAGTALLVSTLPDHGARSLEVRVRLDALPWRVASPKRAEALTEAGSIAAREPLKFAGNALVLTFRPGTFQYRLTSE